MAWYNNIGDLAGDIKDIATGKNPSNQAPPVAIPKGSPSLPVAGGPVATGQTGFGSTQPVPTIGNGGLPVATDSGGDNGILGTIEGVGSSILDFVKNHGGDIIGAIGDYAKKYGTTALEAYNIYQSAQRQAQSDQYAKDALNRSTSGYDAKSGLRSSGIAGLTNPGATVPNLSHLQTLAGAQSGNPFARGGALPVAAPAGPPGRPISAGPVNNTPMPGLSPGQQLTLPAPSFHQGQSLGSFVNDFGGSPVPSQGTLPVALPGANLPPGAGALATGTVKPRTLPFAAPTDRTDGTQDTSLPPRIMS